MKFKLPQKDVLFVELNIHFVSRNSIGLLHAKA